LRELELQTLDKNAKDLDERLRVTARRLDYLERALRKEEIPLLAQDYERQQKAEKNYYAQGRETRLEDAKVKHQEALVLKQKLERIIPTYEEYRSEIEEKRHGDFSKRRREAAEALENEREKRIKAYKRDVLARRKREREEEARLLAEEEKRAEEAEQKRQEEEAKATKLAEARAAKEEEIR